MKKKLMSVIAIMFVVIFMVPTYSLAASDSGKLEYAIFPAKTMNITQIAYESASHANQNAIDFVSSSRIVAPFTCKVAYTDTKWGYVVLQSVSKVRYANGKTDYMTVTLMHDENISNLVEAQRKGTIIKQGQAIYDQGGMGNGNASAYGDHVHMAIYKGKKIPKSNYGAGDTYAFDALFINPEITTSYAGRGKGYMKPGNRVYSNAPSNYTNRWRTLDYFSKCTLYASKITVKTTARTTLKTLPCSKGTCSSSKDVVTLNKGVTLNVTGLYRNSEGNYWYRCIYQGKTVYVFAGNTTRINYHKYSDRVNYYVCGTALWLGGRCISRI